MREAEYWDDINGIGRLEIEIDLVIADESLLFVCHEEACHANKYLFMTYDSFEGIYVFRKISDDELLDMLENRVTMEQTFRNGEYIGQTYVQGEILCYDRYEPEKFDGARLPDQGEYYELQTAYILRYINVLKEKQKCFFVEYVPQKENYYDCYEREIVSSYDVQMECMDSGVIYDPQKYVTAHYVKSYGSMSECTRKTA